MRKLLFIIPALLIVAISATIAACSPVSTESSRDKSESPAAVTTPSSPSIAPSPMPPVMPGGSEQFSSALKSDSDSFDYLSGDRMIVRTGNLQVVVSDVAISIDQINALAETLEGYVVSSNVWQAGDRLFGNISIRIPADNFDSAIQSIRAMADDVTSENTDSQDVTEEFTDLTAKLKNLEATEAQLLKIMASAETVKDTLDVQRELSNVRDDIERTEGRIQYLERTSSTSLIAVSLQQSKMAVDFKADKVVAEDREIVRFYPEISGGFAPYSYNWDLGDGTTSTESTPAHSYKKRGEYNVKLTVTDDRGNTLTKERASYITIVPGWSAGGIVGNAWNGMVAFGRVLLSVAIWLGVFSPVWLIIGGIIFFISRRRKKTKVS